MITEGYWVIYIMILYIFEILKKNMSRLWSYEIDLYTAESNDLNQIHFNYNHIKRIQSILFLRSN
jgi:hypothetical protein